MFWEVTDTMAQFYRAKVQLSHSIVILELVLVEDKIFSVLDTNWDNIQVTFPGAISIETALMQIWEATEIFVFSHKKINL